jgi:hypothetical protein
MSGHGRVKELMSRIELMVYVCKAIGSWGDDASRNRDFMNYTDPYSAQITLSFYSLPFLRPRLAQARRTNDYVP